VSDGPSGLIVFSDLDATLLDEDTYSFEAAREALAALAAREVPLVLCSSKTRVEMERWARTLGLTSPMVAENGGAILWPRAGGYDLAARGTPRPRLIDDLDAIAREADARVRGVSSLSVEEVARLTGLAPDAARDAMAREYDEPFLMDAGDIARVAEAASRRGLKVTRGGRFCHLMGPADKGQAVVEILGTAGAWCRRPPAQVSSVALGDSANDLSMLSVVDRPIVVPRPTGIVDADLARALPHAETAPAPGAAGWNAAVLAVLGGKRLPGVAGPAGGGGL
jgi:mannosyl-3-phosphoglycerate phosphatase family protein